MRRILPDFYAAYDREDRDRQCKDQVTSLNLFHLNLLHSETELYLKRNDT